MSCNVNVCMLLKEQHIEKWVGTGNPWHVLRVSSFGMYMGSHIQKSRILEQVRFKVLSFFFCLKNFNRELRLDLPIPSNARILLELRKWPKSLFFLGLRKETKPKTCLFSMRLPYYALSFYSGRLSLKKVFRGPRGFVPAHLSTQRHFTS